MAREGWYMEDRGWYTNSRLRVAVFQEGRGLWLVRPFNVFRDVAEASTLRAAMAEAERWASESNQPTPGRARERREAERWTGRLRRW